MTGAWRDYLCTLGLEDRHSISIYEFLNYAEIRPLSRIAAKRLQHLSASAKLREIIESRHEDRLELADAVRLAGSQNFDVRRLVQAKPWEAENLSSFIDPMRPRVYSIASAPALDSPPDRIDLVMTVVRYQGLSVNEEPSLHQGTATTYLTRETGDEELECLARVISPLHFSLPNNPNTPVVMFAAGSGIAPFRGFWQARSQVSTATKNLLIYSARSPDELPFRTEIDDQSRAGNLTVHAIFSRVDQGLIGTIGGLNSYQTPRGYVDRLISSVAEDEIYSLVAEYQGSIYLCGQARFARTVISSLETLFSKKGKSGQAYVSELIAKRRLEQDVFTTAGPLADDSSKNNSLYELSDRVEHNNPEQGFWMM
ncbi:MAG: hypothetical protein VW546_05735, partial [Gammaproteobacteria bacterium]